MGQDTRGTIFCTRLPFPSPICRSTFEGRLAFKFFLVVVPNNLLPLLYATFVLESANILFYQALQTMILKQAGILFKDVVVPLAKLRIRKWRYKDPGTTGLGPGAGAPDVADAVPGLANAARDPADVAPDGQPLDPSKKFSIAETVSRSHSEVWPDPAAVDPGAAASHQKSVRLQLPPAPPARPASPDGASTPGAVGAEGGGREVQENHLRVRRVAVVLQYVDMMTQYLFVACFSCISTLLPLIALVVNCIQVRGEVCAGVLGGGVCGGGWAQGGRRSRGGVYAIAGDGGVRCGREMERGCVFRAALWDDLTTGARGRLCL